MRTELTVQRSEGIPLSLRQSRFNCAWLQQNG